MAGIRLAQAMGIIEAALAHARSIDCQPLGIAVLDPGGHLVAFAREDGTSFLRPKVAEAKAYIALGMGMGSRALVERPEYFMTMMNVATEGRALKAPGGVLVRDRTGELFGAVGVTGDVSDRDEACAVTGIEAVGLVAETG